MNWHLETVFQPKAFLVLPMLAIVSLGCECCDEDAGVGIEVGWLWWSLRLGVSFEHES